MRSQLSDRPASVEDRGVPGHWEGDLLGGTHNSYIATLVERQSRYVMLAKIEQKDAGHRGGGPRETCPAPPC